MTNSTHHTREDTALAGRNSRNVLIVWEKRDEMASCAKAVQWQEVHRDGESNGRSRSSQPHAMQDDDRTFDSVRFPRANKIDVQNIVEKGDPRQ